MFLKILNKKKHIGFKVSINKLTIAFSMALFVFLSPYGYAQQDAHQVLPKSSVISSPKQTEYIDFLKELGIGDTLEFPESIINENFQVTVRVIDRNMSTSTDVVLRDGEGKVHEEFLLSAYACTEDYNNIPGNDAAFITVTGREGRNEFNGWMSKLLPGISVFEHPRYDITLRTCTEL